MTAGQAVSAPDRAETATAHGTVAVSMPYWRTPSTIRRAVDAVLGQTHTDLRLYVVNDGDHVTPPWPELADITDPRLVRVELAENRGRYFCDAAVLAATQAPWFAIHDADDVASPYWLATLADACERNEWVAAFAPQFVVERGLTRLEPVASELIPGVRLRHLAHHAAVYRTTTLRNTGGPHPSYRIGFDTLLVNLVALAGPIGVVGSPLYTRHIRAGSLATNPSTGRGSLARRQSRRDMEVLWVRARRDGLPAVVADVPADLTAAVDLVAQKIRTGRAGPPAPLPSQEDTVTVLNEPVWNGWALDRHTAEELAATLYRDQPRIVVETGSGMSTVLLAEYALRTGARVTSLEHNSRYHGTTTAALAARGLGEHADVRLCPLEDIDTPVGKLPWYRTRIPEEVSFALVDGPPGTVGRGAALFALHPYLNPDGWQVWLDDANRPTEGEALKAWATHLPVEYEMVQFPKGCARIFAHGTGARRTVDASDVAVTLLTGDRPDLLARTVGSLLRLAPGLLESAYVAVLHNGSDDATAALLARWDFIDHHTALLERLPVGPAASALLAVPAPRRFTLHLEDDWQVATMDTGWLDQARNVLDEDPRVGQVRLRHRGQDTAQNHMISRKRIWWAPGVAGSTVGPAHYSLNPSLMRSVDTPVIWPADSEKAAARQFYGMSWLVGQAGPGVFRHIGEGASLRMGERP